MFFAGALAGATGSVADNSPLVRKVAFPRLALPLGTIGAQFIQFLLMFATVVPVGLFFGTRPSTALLALVPVVAMQLLFTIGVGLLMATAYVYFRDTRHLLEVALQIWFWLTPIVYSAAMVPAPLDRLFAVNPMALFVTTYQGIVLDAAWPSVSTLLRLLLSTATAAAVGFAVFVRHQRRFAELV
jgi:ABC-type polysaccharide/polyol phosphate export permease